MKVITVTASTPMNVKMIFDNRIPLGKAIQIDGNTLSMSVDTFEFICDIKLSL